MLLAASFPWAYASSSDHLHQHKKPVLIRDHKMKSLDFGTTPDEGNLSPHPGFVWMKAGYSESIERHKVRLTKHYTKHSQLMVSGQCL